MIYFAKGSPETDLKAEDISEALDTAMRFLTDRKSILVIPPDITRAHSGAGLITEVLHKQTGERILALTCRWRRKRFRRCTALCR
ncbi:MAG: hypothetical protein MUC70_00805 [Bacteroidales bacterium]|nr:hypothetical protein [Bacteroidales bacterium]